MKGYRKNRMAGRLIWVVCVAGLVLPAASFAQPPEDDDAVMETDGFGPLRRADRGGPRGRRPGGADGMLWQRLSDEEREAIRAMVAEHFPERMEDFEAATSGDETQQRGRFVRVVSELMRLRELKEKNPQIFELQAAQMRLDFQLRRLAREYRFSRDDAQREDLSSEIRKLAAEKFDLQGVRMEIEIEQLQAKLDHLQRVIEERFSDRDNAIDEMVERITGGGRFDGPPGKGGLRDRLRRMRERRGIEDPAPHAVPQPDPR